MNSRCSIYVNHFCKIHFCINPYECLKSKYSGANSNIPWSNEIYSNLKPWCYQYFMGWYLTIACIRELCTLTCFTGLDHSFNSTFLWMKEKMNRDCFIYSCHDNMRKNFVIPKYNGIKNCFWNNNIPRSAQDCVITN